MADDVAGEGAIEAGVHSIGLRVYYEDTDAAGIVYHANFLKFAERARTEMMRRLGLDHTTLRRRFKLVFTVRRCHVDFLAPARLDDRLEIETRLLRLRGASIDLEQEVRCADRLLARLVFRLALLGEDARAARIPGELAALFRPLQPPA